jgi:hypothetical protein
VLQGLGKARFLSEVNAPSDCNLFVWKFKIEFEGRDEQVAAASMRKACQAGMRRANRDHSVRGDDAYSYRNVSIHSGRTT